jgi:hypothetical protein
MGVHLLVPRRKRSKIPKLGCGGGIPWGC